MKSENTILLRDYFSAKLPWLFVHICRLQSGVNGN